MPKPGLLEPGVEASIELLHLLAKRDLELLEDFRGGAAKIRSAFPVVIPDRTACSG